MLAERLTAQLLAGPPARDPVTVAERLLAIQAQDPRGARLAIRARTRGLAAADVDHALTEERSLVLTWLNRGTLHLVRSDDYPWLHALTAPPQMAGTLRRLSQIGVSASAAERGVAAVERALVSEGPLTRAALRDRVEAARVPTEGQALVHVLALASHRGLVVRGPMVGKQHAYALVRDWLGDSPPVDRERALPELAQRYLAGHGPADEHDLARWAGIPVREARAGLAAVALTSERTRQAGARLPSPRLLGSFDPVLHGWTSREPVLGRHESRIVAGGLFRPFALVRGTAVATWALRNGEVALEPFGRLARGDAEALEADAKDVVRFLAGRA